MKIIQYDNWDTSGDLDYLFMVKTKDSSITREEDVYTRKENKVVRYKKKRDLSWENVNEILSVQ